MSTTRSATGVVGDDGAEAARVEVCEELVPLGALLRPVGGDVVVDVLDDVPASPGGFVAAVVELAGDAFAVVAVEADPGVDSGEHRRHPTVSS